MVKKTTGNPFLDMWGEDYQANCTCGERGRDEERHAYSCPVSPWRGIAELNAQEAAAKRKGSV